MERLKEKSYFRRKIKNRFKNKRRKQSNKARSECRKIKKVRKKESERSYRKEK